MGIDKQSLRVEVKQRLSQMDGQTKVLESESVWGKVEQLPLFQSAQHVLVYWSMPNEVDTHRFVGKWALDKHLYLPVITGESLKVVRFLNADQLVRHPLFPVFEPMGEELADLTLLSMVVVPGLAFDSQGRRLGKGGGFYDRFLPLVPNAFKVGVAFSVQRIEVVPSARHDVPVDQVFFGG